MPAAGFQAPSSWTPDGRFIAYVNTGIVRYASETQGDVWLIGMPGGDEPAPLLSSGFHEANAVFSPDGKWLAFTSNESGQPELYLQAFETGESPTERRAGRELFYMSFDGSIHAVPVRLGPQPVIGAATPLFSARRPMPERGSARLQGSTFRPTASDS